MSEHPHETQVATGAYDCACLCGAVRFELKGPLDEVVLCHCTMCRRGNGGAFNVAVVVRSDQVRFESRDHLKEYESSPGKFRAFCGACGSPIYSRRDSLPQALRLRGGLIIDLPAPAHMRHIHRDSRWPWVDSIEDAPKIAGQG